MAKKYETMSIRVEADIAENLVEFYGNKSQAATTATKGWLRLRQLSQDGMNGLLTKNELKFLIKLTKDKPHPYNIMGDCEYAAEEILTAGQYTDINDSLKINIDTFAEKVKNLGVLRLFFLQDDINRIINGNAVIEDLFKMYHVR